MATGNFDVLSEGFGNLGAALSGVGGIEGKRQQLLQEMRAKAEMEQLLKQAELKQQAEDNARAYAEAQRQALTRRFLDASMQSNELPSGGASNADVIHAALNPAPGQMRQGPNPYELASIAADGDPKALVSFLANERDNQYANGVVPTPKFDLYGREVDSRINENAAQAFSANASGAHLLGAESRAAELHPTIMGEHDASAAIKRIKQAQAERGEARRTGAPVIPGPWSPETSQEDVDFWMKGQSAATCLLYTSRWPSSLLGPVHRGRRCGTRALRRPVEERRDHLRYEKVPRCRSRCERGRGRS